MPQRAHDTQQQRKPTKRHQPSALTGQGTSEFEPAIPPLVLQRAVTEPGRATPGQIRAMQRMGGNRAVVSLLRTTSTGVVQRDGGGVVKESFSGKRSRGEHKETVTSGETTTTTETSYSRLAGAQAAVKNITEASDGTIEKAVLALALAGAFGEAAGKKALEKGLLKLGAEGSVKGGVGVKSWAKVGKETVEKEIVIDGETRKVIESLKYLVEAGVDVSAGGELAGKLEAALGEVGIELAGKLQAFVGFAGTIGADVKLDQVALAIDLTAKAEGKIGVEISTEGEVSVKIGDVVKVTAKVTLSGFVGAKGSATTYLSLSLRRFFSMSYAHAPKSWQGSEGEEKESSFGPEAPEADVFEQYGIDLGAKVEGMTGAMGEQTGELSFKCKDVSIDLTDELNALAGVEGSAGARVALSLTEVTASAKAEAFAGLKAGGTLKGALKYKGRAFITVTGGGSVSLGAGASAEFMFRAGLGRLSISGKAAATLGFGFGFDIGVDIDFTVLAEAIKDIVVKALAAKIRADKHRSQRAVRYGKYFAEGRPELPSDTTKAAVTDKVKMVLEPSFQEYASKKARTGKHGIKRARIQQIIDSHAIADAVLGSYLSTKAGDEALEGLTADVFGKGGILVKITFKAGSIDEFEVDEQAVARQKTLRGSARAKLQKYKRKKAWFGAHGVKGSGAKYLLNDVIRDNTGVGKANPPLDVLTHELESAAKEMLGEDVEVRFTGGTPPRVKEVILHPEKQRPEDAEAQAKRTREMAKAKVLNAFRALNDSKLKKGKGWILRMDLVKIVQKKTVTKLLDYDQQDSAHNRAILDGLQEAAAEAFGLGKGQITFKVVGATVFVDKFPQIGDTERVAATLRYVKGNVAKAVESRFAQYAGKKSAYGSHWVKADKVQKLIDRSGVNKFLGSDEQNRVVLDTILEKAETHFGKRHGFRFEVSGDKKKTVKLESMGLVSKPLPPGPKATTEEKKRWEREKGRYQEAVEDTKAKAKATVEGPFAAYAKKKLGQGKSWIKRERIQALVDRSAVSKFLAPSSAGPSVHVYNQAVVLGITEAAKKAFGARQKLVFRLSPDAKKIVLESIELVAKASPGATKEEKDASAEAIEDTREKAKAAVLPSFQGYAAKAKQSRGKLRRWAKGTENWISKDSIEKLVEKSGVDKFLDPSSPGDATNVHNQAVLQGLTTAAEEAFGGGRQTFLFDLFTSGSIWLKRITHVRKGTDTGIGGAKEETKQFAKAAVGPRFKAYAKKKGGVKHWKQWLGIEGGVRSKHWIKQAQIDRLIAAADLVRYMDPWNPYSQRLPLNQAVLEGVKEAADEAFPPDMVSMTFRLALGNVQVDAFQLKDKAIKFKVASQLYYHLTQYVEGKKGKKNIAQKDYGSLALDVTDIIVNRVPQDYRDNWPVAIHDATEEVGQLVFKGEWGQVNPFLKVV